MAIPSLISQLDAGRWHNYAIFMGRLVCQALSHRLFPLAFFLDVHGAAPTLVMLFAMAIPAILAAFRLISLPAA
jgi:hypothetical protein